MHGAARGLLMAVLALIAGAQSLAEDAHPPTPAQRDYLLACGGCHGILGTSNSKVVPQLAGLVGYYLLTPEGRSYLPRLPNVAFAALSDQALASVLNYVVFDLGCSSVPTSAAPFGAAEVAHLRTRPLTEISLTAYRRALVSDLIERHGAPLDLGRYPGSPTVPGPRPCTARVPT